METCDKHDDGIFVWVQRLSSTHCPICIILDNLTLAEEKVTTKEEKIDELLEEISTLQEELSNAKAINHWRDVNGNMA